MRGRFRKAAAGMLFVLQAVSAPQRIVLQAAAVRRQNLASPASIGASAAVFPEGKDERSVSLSLPAGKRRTGRQPQPSRREETKIAQAEAQRKPGTASRSYGTRPVGPRRNLLSALNHPFAIVLAASAVHAPAPIACQGTFFTRNPCALH